MTEAAAREFTPDAYSQDFGDYARVFTALGHPPDFDPRIEDADSAGALDVFLLDGLGLAALGRIGVYVLGVLTDLGIEKAAEHGTERLWHRFRARRKKKDAGPAEGDSPAAHTGDVPGEQGVPGLVAEVTARLPQNVRGQDGPALEAVVELQIRVYLTAARQNDGRPAGDGPEPG